MGKFEVYRDKKGEYRFRLKAGNGEIIAESEGYKTKQGCMKGIVSVQKNAAKAKIVLEDGIGKGIEYSHKELKKELIRKDKEYANTNSTLSKPTQEIEDEKKTLVKSYTLQKLKKSVGPRWL